MARPPNPNPESVTSEVLPVRLTRLEREGVNELVRRQLAALHATGAGVTAASFVRGLIRRELMAQKIAGIVEPSPAPLQPLLFTAPEPAWAPVAVEPEPVIKAAPVLEEAALGLEAEHLEAARVEAARVEAARVEAARVEAARVEAARVEAARVEAARVEAEPVVEDLAPVEAPPLEVKPLPRPKAKAAKAKPPPKRAPTPAAKAARSTPKPRRS